MKRKTILILFNLLIVWGINMSAQNQQQIPCSQPEASQFDFWIGEWKAVWKDAEGREQVGENVIEKILGSCVISENFDGSETIGLVGKSYSLFDARSGKWKQTWVDNQGSYLDFVGEFADGKMILSREFEAPNGNLLMQRMVWYNITEEEFDWNWEMSKDSGKTWSINWQIKYTRKI